jgi:hypothetical protein
VAANSGATSGPSLPRRRGHPQTLETSAAAMSSPISAGSWCPSDSSSEGAGEDGGDDDAFQTQEVLASEAVGSSRDMVAGYLVSVGFGEGAARRLAKHVDKAVRESEVPDVASDLIDRYGGGSSPVVSGLGGVGGGAAAVPASPLSSEEPPSAAPQTAAALARTVQQSTARVIQGLGSALRSHLSSTTSAKALAQLMHQEKSLDEALSAEARRLCAAYDETWLRPTRACMAEAFEMIVHESRRAALAAARPDLAPPTSAQVFYAGVLLSRLQPSSAATGGGGGGGGGGGMLAAALPSPSVPLRAPHVPSGGGSGGGGGGGARARQPQQAQPQQHSLADFELQLATALALSEAEAAGPGAGGGGGGGIGASTEDAELAR